LSISVRIDVVVTTGCAPGGHHGIVHVVHRTSACASITSTERNIITGTHIIIADTEHVSRTTGCTPGGRHGIVPVVHRTSACAVGSVTSGFSDRNRSVAARGARSVCRIVNFAIHTWHPTAGKVSSSCACEFAGEVLITLCSECGPSVSSVSSVAIIVVVIVVFAIAGFTITGTTY
jgi:hypothetical protein